MRARLFALGISIMGAALVIAGCDLKKITVDQTAAVLKAGGSAFDQETDPEFAREALPASLKTMESFLVANPTQPILLELLAQGYMSYSFAFIENDSEQMQESDPPKAEHLRHRAQSMYWRARTYGMRLLALKHPDVADALHHSKMPTDEQLAKMKKEDVPGLFWTANPWAAAINLGKDDMMLVAQLPIAKKLITRCAELDENYFHAGPRMTWGAMEAGLPKALGGRPDLAREQFQRAIMLTEGHDLMTRVMFAKTVGVQEGDRAMFVTTMEDVLKADPTVDPNMILSNRLAQQRAQRYLNDVDGLFLD